jgi:hypothetical protein
MGYIPKGQISLVLILLMLLVHVLIQISHVVAIHQIFLYHKISYACHAIIYHFQKRKANKTAFLFQNVVTIQYLKVATMNDINIVPIP